MSKLITFRCHCNIPELHKNTFPIPNMSQGPHHRRSIPDNFHLIITQCSLDTMQFAALINTIHKLYNL